MLVVDTGPLVASADPRDSDHGHCLELLATSPGPLVVPVLAITEVAYFLMRRLGSGAEAQLADSLETGGLVAEPVEQSDWTRIRELLIQYSGLNLGITDASIVAVCERLGATKLATLDHRHFSVIRPKHCAALTLLPA